MTRIGKRQFRSAYSDNLLNTYMIIAFQAFDLCGITNILIKLATSKLTEKSHNC